MIRENEFLHLLGIAIDSCTKAKQEAQSKGEAWMVEDSEVAKAQFERIAAQVDSGTLPPSQGAGLGITRALSEWAPEYLYSAGAAVEEFYMTNWK